MSDTRHGATRTAKLVQDAEAAQRAGRADEAERLFQQVVQADPRNAGVWNALGSLALERDDARAAASHFASAADCDPAAAPLWMNLAKAQRLIANTEGERSSLLRVLAIDQRHFMALLRLAELHERCGEVAQAVQRWDGVLALASTMPNRAPALDEVLDRASAFVADHRAQFGLQVDQALLSARTKLDVRDRRRFDACIDAVLGRRAIYTNQCAGLHYPFLPADEFFDRVHFPWFAEIESRSGEIREELAALLASGDGLEPYVAMGSGAPESKWTPLDQSDQWSAFHLWRHGARVDKACERCPATAAALDAVPQARMPGRAPTAFFSILRPRTHIPPHTGVSNVRTIVHLPLIVPDGCGFRVGGETRAWVEGQAFAFDDTIEHEAWNDSDQLRAILIFDVWNPHLRDAEREMINLFYATADESEFGRSHRPGES